ncbi:MAG TPA: hypothetical protein VEA79_00170 [Phenylobacterium sp.]|nr:hypothetical protein [Phenylobacterium sp.]
MLRPLAMLLVAATLSACGDRDGAPPPSAANLAAPNPKTIEPPANAAGQPVAADTTTPAGELPSAASPTRYVGQWAAASLGCADPAWRFEADRLGTKGEVSCAFMQVTPAPGGYDIAARCLAEGEERASTLRLRFAESAKAMLVSGGPFSGEIGLTYCGPPPAG